MAEAQKNQLAKIKPGALDDAARRDYANAFQLFDTSGGLSTIDACLDGAHLFDVVKDGQIVGRYALKPVTRANGCEVFIQAAVGRLPGVALIESILPAIEQQCASADRLTVNTCRRGLVKKLQKQGWTLDAFVLRKKLNG